MAGQQQAMIAETIRAMKLAMKRRPSDSDSDGPVLQHTNRGNKLKRSARHIQEDRLDDTGGLAYRKKVAHAGYTRYTISTNPPLLDDEGDPYSPTSSDYEAERHAEVAEDDPFGHVQLEHLLRPLTSAAELPDHPGLSVPFTSKGLSRMAQEASDMLRRERARLWKAKRLLQRFRGDTDWLPCSTFEAETDEMLLGGEAGGDVRSAVPSIQMDQPMFDREQPVSRQHIHETGEGSATTGLQTGVDGGGEAMDGVEVQDMANETRPVGVMNGIGAALGISGSADPAAGTSMADLVDRETHSETASQSNGANMHAMTTRARARSPADRSDRTPSPSPSDSASIPVVNPWFVASSSSLADRDLGLPGHEAEETRKLLLLYVQKQEQVVRSIDQLHAGLQKADRLRQHVLRSCKAERHTISDGKGNTTVDMSDGEDWYDVTDWNLQPWELKDGKLEKGKDEVEDVEEERGRRPGRGRRVNRI